MRRGNGVRTPSQAGQRASPGEFSGFPPAVAAMLSAVETVDHGVALFEGTSLLYANPALWMMAVDPAHVYGRVRNDRFPDAPDAPIRCAVTRADGSSFDAEVALAGITVGDRSFEMLTVKPIAGSGFARSEPASAPSFEALIESVTDAVVVVDEEFRVIYANPAHATLLGETPESLIGLRVGTYIHPDDRQYAEAFMQEVRAHPGVPFTAEARIRRRDGTWRWVEAVARNRLHDPAVRGIVITSRDTTEQRSRWEDVFHVLASARCILMNANVRKIDGEFVWDARLVNEPMARELLPLDVPPGGDFLAAAHEAKLPEDRLRWMETAHAALEEGKTRYHQEYCCRDRHGKLRWFYEDVIVETIEPGSQWRLVAVVTDITEKKEAELLQSVVYEIGEAVHATPDLDALFRSIHRSLNRLLDAENFYIALAVEGKPDTFIFPYRVDERDAYFPGPVYIPGSLTAYVARTGRPLLIDPERRAYLVETQGLTPAGSDAESWLGVPLTLNDRVIGVVAVQNYEDPRRYSERDVEVMCFVAGQIATAIDRKQAFEQLTHETEILHAFMRHVPDFLYIKDIAHRYVRVNDAFAKAFGAEDPEEIVGKTPMDLYPKELAETILEEDEEVFRTNRPISLRKRRIQCPDGETRWLLVSKSPVHDEFGRLVGLVGVTKDATEEYNTQEALRQSEARVRALLAAVPDLMFRVRRDGTILDFKPDPNIPLALHPNEFLGRNVREIWPRHADTLLKQYEQALDTGDVQTLEYQLYLNEYLHEFESRCVPCGSDEVLVVIRDVTSEKRNLAQMSTIRDISQRLMTPVELDRVYREIAEIIAERFHFPYAGVELYDAESDEMIFVGTAGFAHDRPTGWRAPLDHLMSGTVVRTGEPLVDLNAIARADYRFPIVRRLGVRTFLCVPMKIGDRVLGTLALGDPRVRRDAPALIDTLQTIANHLAQEIERQQAVAALAESEALFRAVYELSTSGIALLDLDGRILEANEAMHEALDFEPGEMIGIHFTEVTPPEHRRRDERIFRRLASGKRDRVRGLTQYRTRRGDRIDAQIGLTLIRDDAGEPQYMLMVGEDVTALRRAEAEVRAMKDQLEERVRERTAQLHETTERLLRSNRELQSFAYILSHDLKEPLRTVTSFIQLLERRYVGKLDSDADEFIGYIVDGIDRMNQMISSLLIFSRVDTRGTKFLPVDVSETVREVVQNLRVMIEESKAVVDWGPLPTVQADRNQLRQLLQNLIENAIKFRGSEPPRVHIEAHREPDSWRFSVRDNGIGIDPRDSERIFAVFQRLHRRDEYPGTGIGLSVCKRIVERHGGRIWVESDLGRGSTFFFTIPVDGGIKLR